MIRKLFAVLTVVGSIAVVLATSACGDDAGKQQAPTSGSSTPAGKKVVLKMTSVFPSSLQLLGDSGTKMAKNVRRLSGGTLELKFFEPGALVPGLEAIPAVAKGSVEAAWSAPGFFSGTDVTFNFFSTVPFGPDAPELLAWLYHGGGNELADELFARHSIKAIPCAINPPQGSGWFRKEIKSLDDLKGLKMRFFGLGARVLDKVGVATQLLAPGDIFQALQLGTIDATEFAMPSSDENFGLYQVAKYYYLPGWHEPSSLLHLFVNLDVWNRLSDQHQAVLQIACGDSLRDTLARGEALQAPALRRMRDKHGVRIISWPSEILDAYRKAWQEVVAEESAANLEFKRVYESYSAFREDYAIWRENGYLK